MKGEDEVIDIISTSHKLAKELYDKPDGFITVTFNGEEYVIDNIQRIPTHVNTDDSITHWTLNLRDGGKGNIKKMKRILCYLKAIPLYLSSGLWCPHVYKEIGSNKGIVITTKNSFRISKDFLHNENEIVHPGAMIIRSRCICCGHEELSWYDSEPLLIRN